MAAALRTGLTIEKAFVVSKQVKAEPKATTLHRPVT